MPALNCRTAGARALFALAASVALAGAALAQAATASPPIENSRLDARMFYELLIGEIELNAGDAGAAFQLVLDSARRSKS